MAREMVEKERWRGRGGEMEAMEGRATRAETKRNRRSAQEIVKVGGRRSGPPNRKTGGGWWDLLQ